MGKGSTPRPFAVKDDVFSENFCRTFGHKWRDETCVNCGQTKPVGSLKDEDEDGKATEVQGRI